MNMAIKTIFSVFLILFLSSIAGAQQLVVVNGGLFGSSTEFTNIGIYNSQNGLYNSLDTIYTNAVQDVLIEENRYIYVAAQDSIVKYDIWTAERVAAARFGATSTIRLGLFGEKLIVGNWYGASEGNLRIFDKNSLSFIDSIPEISKGATDFSIIGNKAFIAQNNTNANYADTLGYIAVVDLDNLSFLRYDTLSTVGNEIGRLVNVGDTMLYSVNGISSTISSLHIASGLKNTVAAAAVLNPKSTGKSVFFDGTKWYLPFNNGIGTYDLVNNSVITADIVTPPAIVAPGAPATYFSFAVDPDYNKIYVSIYDFISQQYNQGLIYNLNGDSIGVFPVGFSPEVLDVLNSSVVMNNEELQKAAEISIFPNPVTDFINIVNNESIHNLEIIDSNGKVLKRFEAIETNTIGIDLSNLPTGIYIARIGSKVKKFIKI